MSERTPYDVLGIRPNATEDEVRQAFRNLAQIYHPDRFDSVTPAVLAEAMRRMQEVNAAYQEVAGLKGTTVYWQTAGWTNRQRADLTRQLLDMGIPHRWSGEELSVDKRYERGVQALRLTRSKEPGPGHRRLPEHASSRR